MSFNSNLSCCPFVKQFQRLSDAEEIILGTDPTNYDTDGEPITQLMGPIPF